MHDEKIKHQLYNRRTKKKKISVLHNVEENVILEKVELTNGMKKMKIQLVEKNNCIRHEIAKIDLLKGLQQMIANINNKKKQRSFIVKSMKI